MQIIVLGCGAAFPRAGAACSGFLLRSGDTSVWLDAGNGTFSRLQEYVPFGDVDALVLTHRHADHIADVLPLMYARGFDEGVREPLPVYSPPDVPQALTSNLGEGSEGIFWNTFDIRPLAEPFEVGPLRFEPFRTVHPVETYGVRVSEDGNRFVYTADTGDFPQLPEACSGADLLLCEATFVRGTSAPPGIHLWAEEAGTVAEKAGAGRLVLTHVWGSLDPSTAVEEASRTFTGPVEGASEDTVYEV